MKKYNVIVNGTAYEIELEVADAASVSAAPKAAAPAVQTAPAASKPLPGAEVGEQKSDAPAAEPKKEEKKSKK